MIWDNGPAHRGEAIRSYLATPDLHLRLVALPAYSPDFNADEAVWDWAREEVTANECLGTKAKVQEKMYVFFDGLTHRKDEVRHRCRTLLQARADALMFTPAVPLPPLQKCSSHLGFGLALYDGIGNVLACSMLPVAGRLIGFVRLTGDAPNCTIIGFPQRTSVMNAALVNGTLGHADEVDAIDDFNTRGSHTLAATMAAALTAGQLVRASGLQVLRSVILGYELSKRVHAVAAKVQQDTGRASGPFDEGNSMGAAAAAGLTLGLSADQMEVAISLAGHLACGITSFGREVNHMTKSFTRGGVGAKNGVIAALMAKADYDAARDILDGRQGFFHSYLGVEDPGPEFLADLGREFNIRGLIFKRNSSGGGLQAPRQALLEIIAESGLAADDISEIQVEMRPSDINSYFTSSRHPADCGDALALAVLYGGMGFKEAHQEKLCMSPEVQAMRKTHQGTTQRRLGWSGVSFAHRGHCRDQG